MEVGGDSDIQNPIFTAGKSKMKSQKLKEGNFLLGTPTFIDLTNGRWRCEETGHDLPTNQKDSYSRSKACRLALIDSALAKNNPFLNTFQPHPVSKSMLVCSLTGDVVNKSEEHIWKHINGRRFLKKLEEKEVEKVASPEKVENNIKKLTKKSNLKESSIQENENLEDGDTVAKEPSFWIPPIGQRWDFDNGRDRWESYNTSDQETEANDNTASVMNGKNEAESMELSICAKRLSIAVDPNDFARRKKKIKTT